MATLSVLKGAFVMNEIQREIFRRASIRSEKLKNFPLNRKKILVEEFSGEKFSDKECSNE
jgi:hypothetical protein